jgi:hypothetical protein
VSADNTTSVMVADDASINYVKWTQLDALKKLKAKSTIYAGTVVVGDMFAAKAEIPAGKASVGLALKEGQYPSDIKSGDHVAVYNVDATGSGSGKTGTGSSSSSSGGLLVQNALVSGVKDSSDATVSTGNLSLTLLVDQTDAAAVARAASANAVAIVRVSGN